MEDLQVSVESAQGLERRIRVNVPAHHIEREVESRLRSVGQNARIKGFRPGKVPKTVIRQRFGDQVRQEVLQELLQSSYAAALDREKFQPAGAPRVEADTIQDGSDLSYTATFEVYPDIELKDLGTLSAERIEPGIGEEDIDAMLENLRRQRANWVPVQRAAAQGDQVTIDFTGTLDGEPLEGGSGEQVPVVLGAGRMLEEFEKALYATSAGDQPRFTVTFPDDYHAESLRGRTAEFTATVHEVAEQQLPEIDAEFIRSFGIESGDPGEFRDKVRENMVAEADTRVRAELKRALFEQLVAGHGIEVPAVLVEREAQSLQADAMRQAGVSDPAQAPAAETFRPSAERRVRLGLLIAAVIRDHGIKVDRNQVLRRVDELSAGYEQPAQVRQLYLQNQDLMTQIEHAVLEDQVVDWLAEKAQLTGKPVAFRELMGG
ncbi:MAG: trigger factor [Chromatiales bacterium]|nr:trigger factor [Chromatiales bacterium]